MVGGGERLRYRKALAHGDTLYACGNNPWCCACPARAAQPTAGAVSVQWSHGARRFHMWRRRDADIILPNSDRAHSSVTLMSASDKCPVDHKALATEQPDNCPVDHGAHGASSEQCPVERSLRSSWTSLFSSKSDVPPPNPPAHATSSSSARAQLPTEREVSSIPRTDGTNWVYPSQAQFYAAMERKNHNPQAQDMKTIIPIHNAVNERAWTEIMKWEGGKGGEKCGGIKLVSFKGRPQDRTPKAYWKTLIG